MQSSFLFIKAVLTALQKPWLYKENVILFPAKINYAIHRKIIQIF